MSANTLAAERLAAQFAGYPAADLIRLGDVNLRLVLAYCDARIAVLEGYTLASHGWTRCEAGRAEVRRLEGCRGFVARELAAREAGRAVYDVAAVLEGCACPLCLAGGPR